MQLFIYYKTLELDRDSKLKLNARNFDASMCISTESKVFNGGLDFLIGKAGLYLEI